MSGASDWFKKLAKQLPAIQEQVARDIILVEAERMWAENFRREGFTDTSFQPWPQRQNQKGAAAGRGLLTGDTLRLKDAALRGRVVANAVEFMFPEDYMRLHNEGGEITITVQMRKFFWAKYYQTGEEYFKHLAITKNTKITIPKRQFIGQSAELERRITAKVTQYLDRKLNGL